MDTEVEPFDHKLLEGLEDVKMTDPPAQKAVAPLTEIVGADGKGISLTVIDAAVEETHPFALT